MKQKIIKVFFLFVLFFIVFQMKSFAKTYQTDYYNISVPDTFVKNNASSSPENVEEAYFSNLKWDNDGYVMIQIYIVKKPLTEKYNQASINAEAQAIEAASSFSCSYSILNKDLTTISDFETKRLAYENSYYKIFKYYYDEYTVATNNFTTYIKFITNKKNFINSNEQKNILKSIDVKDEKYDRIPFSDVSVDKWYYNAVKYTYQNNLIAGYNKTTFAPNDKLTRGMIVTILYRMENSPNNDGKSGFSDVESNKWYSKAIKWAVENEIVHGYGGTNNFGPNNNIIRQDLVVILRNYAKFKNKDINQKTELTSFSDSGSVGKYAINAVKWAVKTGVITGNANKTINPLGNATRAEAAAMIQKYCNKIGK